MTSFQHDATGAAAAQALQALDHDLVERMRGFRPSSYGKKWFDGAIDAYTDFEGTETEFLPVEPEELQMAMPWAFHSFVWGRKSETLAEHFLREQGRQLPAASRALLEAQLRAWCSCWRVDVVDPGVGLGLVDLLSQENRFVHERMGSANIAPGTVILGRVVDVGEISFLAGLHPYTAPLFDALPLVASVKRWARVRTRPVPLDFLRIPRVQGWMIGEWRWLTNRLRRPPTLTNTEGDLWENTTDHLSFAPADRAKVIARLSALDGANEPFDEGEETVIVITGPGNARNKSMEDTVIGQIAVTANRLRVNTNSTRRADALRSAVLARTKPLVKHLLREEESIDQLLQRAQESAARGVQPAPRPKASPDEIAIVRAYKQKHYTAWLDDAIPALGGKTPRAAVRSARSREQLDALLASMAENESRLPAEERFDFGWVREQLGMTST